jgi:hypothetical protein
MRKSKPKKPRHRVKWPAEQWGANERIEIDVFVRQSDKPAEPPKPLKNDPDKIPTRITDHRTGEVTDHPQRENKPKPIPTLDPATIAASNATLAAIRDGVKKAAAGEKMEVTPEPDQQPPDNKPNYPNPSSRKGRSRHSPNQTTKAGSRLSTLYARRSVSMVHAAGS